MKHIARIGLIAKGIMYCLLGLLAFMAAFEIGGQNGNKADKKGVLQLIEDQPGGKLLAILIAVGLLCYSVWRLIEAFARHDNNDLKKTAGKRIRYFFSGLLYLSFCVYAWNHLLGQGGGEGDGTQDMASQLLQKPFGQWLVGIVALIFAGTGIYQIYYALSEKYKKHVQGLNLHNTSSRLLLRAGKTGYIARGIVWLIISWLLIKAAVHANSKEAGDTGKAFQFLESASFGSYLLGALGLGLICYGFFNFIRARYESFRQ